MAALLWPLGLGLWLGALVFIAGLIVIAALVVMLIPLMAVVGIREGIRRWRATAQLSPSARARSRTRAE